MEDYAQSSSSRRKSSKARAAQSYHLPTLWRTGNSRAPLHPLQLLVTDLVSEHLEAVLQSNIYAIIRVSLSCDITTQQSSPTRKPYFHGSAGWFGQQGTNLFLRTESSNLWIFSPRQLVPLGSGTMLRLLWLLPKCFAIYRVLHRINLSPSSLTSLTLLGYRSTNRAGCGWYNVSFEGDILFQRSCVFEFITSALMAEALSIRSALVHASEAGIFKICIKSDCQALIAAISSKWHSIELFGIIRDIETLFLRFSCISFSFIPRSVNCMADTLAKSVLHSAFPN